MGIITMDGYTFELIHKVQTTQNTLCIYKITREADSDPEYFLSSAEFRPKYIEKHLLCEIKGNIMPQHYEAFFDNELTAVLMAQMVALKSYIDYQRYELENAENKLHEANQLIKSLIDRNSIENVDCYQKFYDNQDQSKDAYRELSKNQIKEDENNG